MTPRLPNNTQRIGIYGKTGSGKTLAGCWHLSNKDFTRERWEILDFKLDKTIGRIPRLEELDIDAPVGKQKGLYVRRPAPGSDDAVEDYLIRLYQRGNTGLMIDEGYEINRLSKALRRLLTQGRSLKIPMITLSQRPSWISPFLMSESDFHQVFFMTNPADNERIQEWIPGIGPLNQDYYSYYYDVAKDGLYYFKPVPNENNILDKFDSKVPRRIHLFRGITSNERRKRR